MLSADLINALTILVNGKLGVREPSADEAEQAWQTVQLALADAASQRAQMQRSALARAEKRGSGATGRPPSTEFAVSMGDLWERRVLGIQEAHDLVVATLAEHAGNGKPPTRNSMQVAMSTKGSWWRHMATADGEHDLSVKKVA